MTVRKGEKGVRESASRIGSLAEVDFAQHPLLHLLYGFLVLPSAHVRDGSIQSAHVRAKEVQSGDAERR